MRARRLSSLTFIVSTLLLSSLVACSDPHNYDLTKITDEQSKVLFSKLTKQELTKLMAFSKRYTLLHSEPPPGFTVKQALKSQDDWEASQKVEAGAAEVLKKKVEAEKQAKQQAFSKVLLAALTSKKNATGEFDRKTVQLYIAFENKGDKDIVGVKGVLRLTDMFGDKILNINLSYDEPIEAKKISVYPGQVKINEFVDNDRKLWDADLEKIRSKFDVITILFKDGTRLDAS